jgi:hypothetical protein
MTQKLEYIDPHLKRKFISALLPYLTNLEEDQRMVHVVSRVVTASNYRRFIWIRHYVVQQTQAFFPESDPYTYVTPLILVHQLA